jgi:hypothetical protein
MDKKTIARELVQGFGKTLTLEALTLDERTNSCVLIFDGSLVINIEYDEQTQRLVLSSYLRELPTDNCEPLLRELLAANLYWHRTQGATLCLEEGTGGIILVYGHSVSDLDGPGFETVMQNFANQAERWTRRLAQAAQATPAQAEPMARPGTPMLFG